MDFRVLRRIASHRRHRSRGRYIGFIRGVKRFGGLKVFHFPLDLSVQSLIRVSPILGQRRGVGHIHYFLKDTALATLQDCGYKIIDSRYTASLLELPIKLLAAVLWQLRGDCYTTDPDLAVRVLGGYCSSARRIAPILGVAHTSWIFVEPPMYTRHHCCGEKYALRRNPGGRFHVPPQRRKATAQRYVYSNTRVLTLFPLVFRAPPPAHGTTQPRQSNAPRHKPDSCPNSASAFPRNGNCSRYRGRLRGRLWRLWRTLCPSVMAFASRPAPNSMSAFAATKMGSEESGTDLRHLSGSPPEIEKAACDK